mgnify:CR=1 FL=1
MAYFLAVYTMKPESLAGFYARSKAEQDAIDAEGLPKWEAWEQRNAQALVNRGGTAPASNDFCGYVVVEAETIEAAADLFRDHPHFSVFPGDTVDLMPFLAGPDLENKPAR